MKDLLRVVIADDHLLVREGIKSLLEAGGDVIVVADARDAQELIARTDEHRPDAVVTDIRMPHPSGTDGIHAALEIRRRFPEVGVVVLSQHLEDSYVVQLFAEGTAGLAYLLKERIGQRSQLVHAIRETANGGSVIDPRVVDALIDARSRRQSPIALMPDREREVLQLMAEGFSNPAIAESLHISLSSVEKHVGSIFARLGIQQESTNHRRVAAVLAYLRSADRGK